MNTIITIILATLAAAAALFGGLLAVIYIPSPVFEPSTYAPIRSEYWPTDGFRITSPEEQGMNSEKLVEMVKAYEEDHAKDPANSIDSITIIRNGYLVADIYLDPLYPPDTQHVLHSAAKSIASILIGIAIDQGYIEGVDVPIIDFFKDKEMPIADEKAVRITLHDLLTMQTGLRSRDSYIYHHTGLWEMFNAGDLVEHFFSLPVDAEGGTRFDYSNLAYFMITAILEQTTGIDPVSFARKNLFEPLGIKDASWFINPDDLGLGFVPMWMKPHDMAKIGLLFLQKGQWDGRQIVSTEWVETSVFPHAYPKNYVEVLNAEGEKDDEGSQTAWVSNKFFKPFTAGYGYMWWLDKQGNYNALGTAGQYLIVAPDKNLVVMISSSSSDMGVFFPKKLFYDYILKAVNSDGAISENETAQRELKELSLQPELLQETKTIGELPKIANDISGRTYSLEENRWDSDEFKLIFDSAPDYALFSFKTKLYESVTIQIGLDGIYRFTETTGGGYAAFGSWISADTFEIDYQHIGYSSPMKLSLLFDQDRIEVTETGVLGATVYKGTLQPAKAEVQ